MSGGFTLAWGKVFFLMTQAALHRVTEIPWNSLILYTEVMLSKQGSFQRKQEPPPLARSLWFFEGKALFTYEKGFFFIINSYVNSSFCHALPLNFYLYSQSDQRVYEPKQVALFSVQSLHIFKRIWIVKTKIVSTFVRKSQFYWSYHNRKWYQ